MSEREPNLRAVFCDAAEIEDSAARAAFLDRACAGNAELRQRVEQLLAADTRAGGFLGSPPRPDLETAKPGERIGRYRIIERLGQGGYGVVYRAEQEEPVRREVALKIIKLGMDTRAVVARFELERQALAVMDHPNIARVLDAGATDSGRPFFVMELVRGEPITDYCRRRNLSLSQRLELFIGICHAVQHAHQKGIIHRDLKPSNILVAETDGVLTPKVIDFGIAKATENTSGATMTAAHDFIGTPAYMSPEQVTPGQRDIDTRCDIYGLGVVLYELMAGQPPFDPKVLDKAGLQEIYRIIRDVNPPKPSTRITKQGSKAATEVNRSSAHFAALHSDVDWIVMKCLEKDRARRYATANALALDLQRHLNHEPVTARPPSSLYRFQKVVRRNRLAFSAAAIIAAVLVVAVIVSSRSAVRASRAERLAEAKATESEDRLLHRFVAEGNRLLEQNRTHAALPLLVEALGRERDSMRQKEGRIRLALALDTAPQLRAHVTQGGDVFGAALSPGGKWLATGADDGTVRLSSIASGGMVGTNLPLGGVVASVAFSPDGALLAAASWDGWTCVWEVPSGRPMMDPVRRDDFDAPAVRRLITKLPPSLQFSKNSRRLLHTWGTSVAQWRDATNGILIREFNHGGLIWNAALSKSGKFIATSGNDGVVRVWETETGQPVGAPLKHAGMIAWSDFSPDEKQLLAVRDRRAVQVWDWRAGKRLGPEIAGSSVMFSARFSPGGKSFLASYWGGVARLHEAATGRMLAEFLHDGGVVSAVFSPDGSRVAVACHNGSVWVWNTHDPRLPTAVLPMGDAVNCVAFSSDGLCVVGGARGGRARVWDLAGPDRHMRQYPVSDGRFVAWNPTGDQFLAAGGARAADVRFYDAATGKQRGRASFPGRPATLARYSPDGQRALLIAGNTLHVFESNATESIAAITHGSPVLNAEWLNQGRSIITAARADGIRVWNARDGSVSAQVLAGTDTTAFALSADGGTAATAHADRVIRLWVVSSNMSLQASWSVPYQITRLHFAPQGKLLGVAGDLENGDSVLELRKLSGGELVASIPNRNTLNAFEFTSDGRRVAIASEDGTARVWDVRTGNPLSPRLVLGYAVEQSCFSPDGTWLATIGERGFVRLWNAHTGEPLTTLFDFRRDRGDFHGQFSPDGQRFLFTTGAQVARVLDLRPDQASVEQLQAQARALACMSVEPDGSLTPLDSAALQRAWETLRSLRQAQP